MFSVGRIMRFFLPLLFLFSFSHGLPGCLSHPRCDSFDDAYSSTGALCWSYDEHFGGLWVYEFACLTKYGSTCVAWHWVPSFECSPDLSSSSPGSLDDGVPASAEVLAYAIMSAMLLFSFLAGFSSGSR